MQLFVLKCGATDCDNTVIGRNNIEVNKKGVQYAHAMAEELAGIPIDDIYSSPLTRAFTVAVHIHAEQKNNSCKLFSDDALIDIDYGTLTGSQWANANVMYHRSEPFMKMPRGESFMDVIARVYPFINHLKEKYSTHDRIAIVTHEPVIQAIEVYCNGMSAIDLIYNKKKLDGIIRYDL